MLRFHETGTRTRRLHVIMITLSVQFVCRQIAGCAGADLTRELIIDFSFLLYPPLYRHEHKT